MNKTPMEILSTHGPIGSVTTFLSRIEIGAGGCWLWGGTIDRDGYGIFMFCHHRKRAHRLAYEWAFGEAPALLDHIVCDTRNCANPFHVQPSTNRDNTLRGTGPTADNAKKTHCYRGHPLPSEANRKDGSRRCQECRKMQPSYKRN